MSGHAYRTGGSIQADDAYNGRVVRMFFGVLVTVSIVAMSAAVIVSAVKGTSGGSHMTAGGAQMTAGGPQMTAGGPQMTAGGPQMTAGGPQMTAATPGMSAPGTSASSGAVVVKPVVHLTIAGGSRLGSDGKMHDAFSITNYAVRVGQPVKLVIDNTDSAPHSITAAAVGVNIVARPGIHTYTLVVQKAGRFLWLCTLPCDTEANGWAMSRPGFMSGYITAT
jgi:hypothetical protein